MQEPGDMREQGTFRLADFFPMGIVIDQEQTPPHRVRVRIPGLHRDLSDEELPYFRIALPLTMNGHNGVSGQFVKIAHGTQVITMLYDRRGYSGFVLFGVANAVNSIKEDGDSFRWRDEKGNSFNVSEDGTMTLTGHNGGVVKMIEGKKLQVDLEALELNVGNISITGETLVALVTTISQTADVWNVFANSPAFEDSSGGGGNNGEAPTLTPVDLPDAIDMRNRKDL